jgi:hypothetical protein
MKARLLQILGRVDRAYYWVTEDWGFWAVTLGLLLVNVWAFYRLLIHH